MSSQLSITIDDRAVEVEAGTSVLHAAQQIGIDIPTLCHLEQCGPLNTCQVCLVKVNGRLVPSCGTRVEPGMIVESESAEVHEARRTALELLFSDHVGDCLSPCHRLCPLQMNIPLMIRQIQRQDSRGAVQTVREALPLASVLGRLCHHPCEQGCRRGLWDEPAAIRDMERHVADEDLGLEGSGARPEGAGGTLPTCQPFTGKSVVIVGSGPAGLAAAWHLFRRGHAVTVADRHSEAGGSLRAVPGTVLPGDVLHAELAQLKRLGIRFMLGFELGSDLTLSGLRRGFDLILLATGESDDSKLLLDPMGDRGRLRVDAKTGQTNFQDVFAAGSLVRPVKQLVRAMAEGKTVAESADLYLRGKLPRRPEKPFSSVLGRLSPGELKRFLRTEGRTRRTSPCDACAGLNPLEATREASRCLHCDCRSSGSCALQHWATVYSANANRFRSERREFVQERQHGGILFEPGKCILCGICVRLCEQAQEELGLSFVGRGFDVRVAAPFGEPIEAGLQKVASACVEHCPTGALVMEEPSEEGRSRGRDGRFPSSQRPSSGSDIRTN